MPISAVLAHDGEVLAAGHNQRVQKDSAIPHGETDTVEKAALVGTWWLGVRSARA